MSDPTATRYAAYLAIHLTAGTTPRSFEDWRGEYERARYVTTQDINEAVRDWSPPTEAQQEAGNYQKPTISWNGLRIKIENPRGTKRRPEWKPLAHHYGYIARTEDRDGDAVDCYVGPHLESEIVFVVDQEHPGGRFDEHKVCLAFRNVAEARKGYLDNYQDGWHCGPITAMTIDQFKAWLERGDTKARVAEQVSRYTAREQLEKIIRDAGDRMWDDQTIAAMSPVLGVPEQYLLGRVHQYRDNDSPERYARKHLKSSAGQQSLHFESAAPVGKHAWTEEDERKHPRGEGGEWVEKDGAQKENKSETKEETKEPDKALQDHVANLHDAMQERLGAGKQFLARHAGKPLWISSGDHIRLADDRSTVEHTDPEGKWVRADLAQLDHWADKAGLQPFTGPEGILTSKEAADAPERPPAGKTAPEPTPAPKPAADQPRDPGALESGDREGPGERTGVGRGGAAEKLTGKQPDPHSDKGYAPEVWRAVQEKLDQGEDVRFGTHLKYWTVTPDRRGFLRFRNGTIEMHRGKDQWDAVVFGALDSLGRNVGVARPEAAVDEQAAKQEADRAQAEFDQEAKTSARWKAVVDAHFGGDYGRAIDALDEAGGQEAFEQFMAKYESPKPTEDPNDRLRPHDQELPANQFKQPRDVGDGRGSGGDRDGDPEPGTDREGESGGGRPRGMGEADPPAGTGEQPGPLPEAGPRGEDVGAEPPAADQGDEDEPPEDEAQPEGPAGINEPYEPLEPEVPEIDDSEPPEEYLAHERPNDLGERIKTGDAAAADEVVRRIDEQYPEGAQGPKADRARAIRKKLVEDFGEKIGGARKDMARPLGPRGKKAEQDDRPGWARRYSVSQITKSTNKAEEGKWAVSDAKHKNWYGQPRQIGVFATKEEAERSIPLAEVARTHGVTIRGSGDAKDYVIYRKVSDRKHPVVRGGFKSNDEAMRYMASHPDEIIEHQFPRYEQYQYLDHVQRQGGKPRGGNTTPRDFHQEFGFRGGEFGNWQSGRDGQEALNHAHDALRDLADVLGVEPAGISLGGDLAIAFGARGTGGKDAARAHYEPTARVINLTKMRGAGTLAHEFAHALDNYFARQAKIPGERYGKYEWVTEGLPHKHNLRPEVAEAWTNLVKSMTATEQVQEVPVETTIKQRDKAREYVADHINKIEKRHAESVAYWTTHGKDRARGKRGKDFTPEQKQKWDELKDRLINGDVGKQTFVEGSPHNRFGGYSSYEVLQEMNQLYKQVTGRSFHTADKSSDGAALYWSVKNALDAEKRIGESAEPTTKTVRKATNYFQAARDMDETRASSYYTIPTEMLARAFEAYVYDKLAAEGRRSDYLVGKAENKYYQMFDMAPFPEGDERTTINAAFDRLFSTMQQRPRSGDKGEHVELYRAEPLRRLAKDLYAAWYDRTQRGP